jgi:K+-transporting ATPase ATPase C chain
MMKDIATSLRTILGTIGLCAVLYPAAIWGFGRALVPERARGSLIAGPDGAVIGSRLVAQRFEQLGYLWPRPSAVDYNAAAAGGSNLASGNPALRARATSAVAHLAATEASSGRAGKARRSRTTMNGRPVPAELVAASGSGLDPHVTLAGALYQAPRIAGARGVKLRRVTEILSGQASTATPWSPRLVNVLVANLALDRDLGRGQAPP